MPTPTILSGKNTLNHNAMFFNLNNLNFKKSKYLLINKYINYNLIEVLNFFKLYLFVIIYYYIFFFLSNTLKKKKKQIHSKIWFSFDFIQVF